MPGSFYEIIFINNLLRNAVPIPQTRLPVPDKEYEAVSIEDKSSGSQNV